jgi:hypothetical protein
MFLRFHRFFWSKKEEENDFVAAKSFLESLPVFLFKRFLCLSIYFSHRAFTVSARINTFLLFLTFDTQKQSS